MHYLIAALLDVLPLAVLALAMMWLGGEKRMKERSGSTRP